MDPTKIKMRYLLGVFCAAVLIAGLLRHFLHVEAGFSRKQILVGALIAAVVSMWLAWAVLRRKGHL
jgi:hypothetical protein